MDKNLPIDSPSNGTEFLRLFPGFPKKYNTEFKLIHNAQSVPVIRRVAWFGAFVFSSFSIADILMDKVNGPKAAAIRLLISLFIIIASRLPIRILVRHLQLVGCIIVITILIGYSAIGMMIPFVRANAGTIIVPGNLILLMAIFGLVRLLVVPATLAGLITAIQFNVLVFASGDDALPILLRGNMHIVFAVIAGSWVGYRLEALARRQFLTDKENNILISQLYPGEILKWVKDGRRDAVAETDATVAFLDIVESTKLAQLLDSPQQLVKLLDTIFTGFDRIAVKYNVEKIKTIGDGYMAVSGAQVTANDDTEAVVNFALEAVEFVREYAREQDDLPFDEFELNVRVGIHRGRVVSGLIGVEKRYFDLWGRTVNMASRLEAYSDPGRVAVSAAVYRKLQNLYEFEERSEIEMKGLGPVRSFFVLSRRAEGKPAAAASESPARLRLVR